MVLIRFLFWTASIFAVTAASAQQFTPVQSAIADFFISEDIEVFKSGGASIIEKAVRATPTTAKEMRETYLMNEVAGDQAYFKKKLLVTANIISINSGIGNRPFLTLEDGDSLAGTRASFKSPNVDKIAKMKKGSTIKLVCFGAGSMLGTPVLSDCEFADEIAKKEASVILRDVAFAQIGQGDMLGSYLWEMIQQVERRLSSSTKCGSDPKACTIEVNKISATAEFKKAMDNF